MFQEKLPRTSVPEMARTDLAPVVLQLKALGIDDIMSFVRTDMIRVAMSKFFDPFDVGCRNLSLHLPQRTCCGRWNYCML